MNIKDIAAGAVLAVFTALMAVRCTPAVAAFEPHRAPEMPSYEWDENKIWETVRRDNDRYLDMLQKGEIKHGY